MHRLSVDILIDLKYIPKKKEFLNRNVAIFGLEHLQDNTFLYWLATRLELHDSNFKCGFQSWVDLNCEEWHGRKTVSLIVKQQVGDLRKK